MKVPSIYCIIAEHLFKITEGKPLPKSRMRSVLRWKFRIPKEKLTTVIAELIEFNLITLQNHKTILIH